MPVRELDSLGGMIDALCRVLSEHIAPRYVDWASLLRPFERRIPSKPAVTGSLKQAGYMTANLNRSVRQIVLAFSGASIHDNTAGLNNILLIAKEFELHALNK